MSLRGSAEMSCLVGGPGCLGGVVVQIFEVSVMRCNFFSSFCVDSGLGIVLCCLSLEYSGTATLSLSCSVPGRCFSYTMLVHCFVEASLVETLV
jgi:hypothetical protein